MTPFQTKCFFRYVDSAPFDGPEFDKEVARAITEKKRTKSYEAFKQIVHELGGR